MRSGRRRCDHDPRRLEVIALASAVSVMLSMKAVGVIIYISLDLVHERLNAPLGEPLL